MKKIKIHYTYYIISISFILTGEFLNLLIFTSLIIIHELGHYLACLLVKINVKKIIIYPYGGITKTEDIIDIDFKSELLISISGIIMQFIYFLIINLLYKNYLIREYTYNLFYNYHYSMLIFNLIPIYPLDGSKILNAFLNVITTYKNSLSITIIISYIFIIILSLLFFNLNKIIAFVIIFLMLEVNRLYKQRKELFNKFLLERYLNNFEFKKKKTIMSVNKMKKDYKHLFYIDGRYLTENYFLKKMFDIR